MLIVSTSGGINGKCNLCIRIGNLIYSCELESPTCVRPALGGMMSKKDVKRLVKFLESLEKKKGAK